MTKAPAPPTAHGAFSLNQPQHDSTASVRFSGRSGEGFQAAILRTLGHALRDIAPGRLIRFGPRQSCWAKLFPDQRGGVYGDWCRGLVSHWVAHSERQTPAEQAAMHQQIAEAQRAHEVEQRTAWAANDRRNAKLWAEAKPAAPGDCLTHYLAGRGLGAWPVPECIRCHPALPYWHTNEDGELHNLGRFPAMLAPIVRNGRLLAVHRTYLNGGRKALVPTAKKLTSAAGPLAGACIPLAVPRGGVLGIAEGIETAAAASLGSGLPVVAAYCASALAGFHWPAEMRRLVIFADCDDAGRAAAQKLRVRALAARMQCSVVMPSAEGADWCDVWAAREGAAA